MAAGDLITTAWQLELNELLMGPSTPYTVRELDLWAAPEVRTADSPRVQAHGTLSGQEWLGERRVVARLYVDTAGDRQSLTAAWRPSDDGEVVPLVWMEDDGELYRVHGKPRLADVRVEPGMPAECRFVCTDPRIYANTASVVSTGLSTTSGGLTFAATAPFVFGSAGSSSVMECVNAGTFPTSWVATFTGPLVAPGLVELSTGRTVSFPGVTLAAGESLVVDADARTVMLNGTASRYSWLSSFSRWFDLQPGSTSVQLTGASGAGAVELSWRSAWI